MITSMMERPVERPSDYDWWAVPRHQCLVKLVTNMVWVTLIVVVTWVTRDTFNVRDLRDMRERLGHSEMKSNIRDDNVRAIEKRVSTLEKFIVHKESP